MSAAPAPYRFFHLAGALEYLGDSQGVRDMLPLFVQTLARDVPEIAQLLAKGDAAEAALRLHSLKGFLPVFCFPELAEELARVEKMCRLGDSAQLQDAYAALALQLSALGDEVAHFGVQSA